MKRSEKRNKKYNYWRRKKIIIIYRPYDCLSKNS